MLSPLGARQRQRWPKLMVGKPSATGCAQVKAPQNPGRPGRKPASSLKGARMQDSSSRPDGRAPERRAKGSSLPLDVVAYIDDRIDEKMAEAFVDGDPAKHKAEHQELINAAMDRKALWKSVREKVLSGGVWAAILFLSSVAWEWFKREVSK